MRPIHLFLILTAGSGLFVAACVLEFIIVGFLGIVLIPSPGFGVPFRFFALGLPAMSNDYFSVTKLFLDWLIWCLVFAALFYSVRALIRSIQ